VRLAAVRAALVLGVYSVLSVEVAGAFRALTRPVIGSVWLCGLLAAGALAWWRWRGDSTRAEKPEGASRIGAAWRAAGRAERAMLGTLGGLLLVELVIALLAAPNNYDSQTYHLPRIEHWVAQRTVAFFPTAIHRQVTLAPGSEYLLLHLRLLTGGDVFYNLVQWGAGAGCLLVASRIAAQLGGGTRAQLITAFVAGTTPMVTLQATSTQTDLMAAFWAACVASIALDGLRRRADLGAVLALGAGTGLAAVTKNTGLLGAVPMLILWGVAQLRLARQREMVRRAAVTCAASVVVLIVAAAIVGPFLARVNAEFGNPLGPPQLRDSIPMQRHDPAAIAVNALRVGHTALDTPIGPLRRASASAIVDVAHLLGVDPQDRRITFGSTSFPVRAWYPDEDRVSFPISGALAIVAATACLARPRRTAPEHALRLRGYAGAVALAVLLYVATVKWQPWGNRLLLFALVLACPLIGVWLEAALCRRRTAGRARKTALAVVTVLSVAALAATLSIGYGYPRRLVGTDSLFTLDRWQERFVRRPQWAAEFQWAAAGVRAADARRVGLVQQNDNWEYPWWLLLRGRQIVALQSVLPHHPPADPRSVDAIICTGDERACRQRVPAGWRLEFHGYVGYALPQRLN
jgi:4-amino-4-deoxy-L-arabinose transferase-like glycosyltransferase